MSDESDGEFLDPAYIENGPFWNYRNDDGVGEELHDRISRVEDSLKALMRKAARESGRRIAESVISDPPNVHPENIRALFKNSWGPGPAGNADPSEATRNHAFTKGDLALVIAVLDQAALGNIRDIGGSAQYQAADIHGELCELWAKWESE